MRRKVTYWLAIVLFAVAVGWWAIIGARKYTERHIKLANAAIDIPPRFYGSPTAKVKIVGAAPMGMGCQGNAQQLLIELAKEEPERVRLELYDNQSTAARQMGMAGCAVYEINGKSEFKVKRGDEEITVAFRESPDAAGGGYYSTDLVRAADQELKRVYGSGLKPDGIYATLDELDRNVGAGLPAPEEYPEPIEQLGGDDAAVRVVAYWPLMTAQATEFRAAAQRLRALAHEYPERLSVALVKVDTDEGRERAEADRIQPPALLINGSPTHEVTQDGKARKVTFYGRMGLPSGPDDATSDMEAVIRKLVPAAHEPPADTPPAE